VTASDIHKEIQQICAEHVTCPPLRVQELAEQFHEEKNSIAHQLDALATLGLIEYQDDNKEVFILTVSGQLARLP
jgi:predicted transcriptional regulator